MSDVTINGHCDDKFAVVQDTFEKNFRLGIEVGAAYTVMIEEEAVVDLWAGHRDAERSSPWAHDTIVPVASCSKVVAGFCGQLLIDRGQLQLDECVAHYWPEFAQHGKENITVRQVFSHSTGIPAFEPSLSFQEMCNWDVAIANIEAQSPWWEPGTSSGYHATTFGFLVGELCARISGVSFIEFYEKEVRAPLDLDFFYALDESLERRLSTPINADGTARAAPEPGTIAARVYSNASTRDREFWHEVRGVVPSGSGRSNARAMARLGTAFATGAWQGQHFLSRETIREVHTEQIYTEDLVMGAPVRWGLGVGLTSKEVPIPFENAFHWGGRGGSIVVMEPDRRAAWAYSPNNFRGGLEGDDRSGRLSAATIRSLRSL